MTSGCLSCELSCCVPVCDVCQSPVARLDQTTLNCCRVNCQTPVSSIRWYKLTASQGQMSFITIQNHHASAKIAVSGELTANSHSSQCTEQLCIEQLSFGMTSFKCPQADVTTAALLLVLCTQSGPCKRSGTGYTQSEAHDAPASSCCAHCQRLQANKSARQDRSSKGKQELGVTQKV